MYTRMLRRYYLTEAPLPADMAQVARLVGARQPEEVAAVEAVLGEFFTMQDDGWHQKRADENIAKYLDRVGDSDEKRVNEAERKRRYRERRAELFAKLRDVGVTPAFDTPTDELVRLLSHGTRPGQDGDGTATHTPVTKHQTPEKQKKARAAKTSLPDGFALSERVKTWAAGKGYDRLDEHFESFVGKAKAKGYVYTDWDEGLMGAIREDWAQLRGRTRGGPAKHGDFDNRDYGQGGTL